MIRPKPTKFLVHLPNTETQHKKVATKELQFPRMLFNDFVYSCYAELLRWRSDTQYAHTTHKAIRTHTNLIL